MWLGLIWRTGALILRNRGQTAGRSPNQIGPQVENVCGLARSGVQTSRSLQWLRRLRLLQAVVLGVALGCFGVCSWARAQAAPAATPAPAQDQKGLDALRGRIIRRIEIVSPPGAWQPPDDASVPLAVGSRFTPSVVRQALMALLKSGEYADARVVVEPFGDAVSVRFVVVPRRIVGGLRLVGGQTEVKREEILRRAGVDLGSDIVLSDLERIADKLRAGYAERGYPESKVDVELLETDDPLRVVLSIRIEQGQPLTIDRVHFTVWPSSKAPGLASVLKKYDVSAGDRFDEELFSAADRELEAELVKKGWLGSRVGHRSQRHAGLDWLVVEVWAGPKSILKFEGNRHYDATQLMTALELADREDLSPAALAESLEDFYVQRGFLDVQVDPVVRGAPTAAVNHLVFIIREREPVRVVAREYPCLTGDRSAAALNSEIDSFLSEALPGGGLLNAVDPRAVDAAIGAQARTGSRPVPYQSTPWHTYVPEVYERALKHVQDLYRSEGYLSAVVGPVRVLRRRCDIRSPAGQCRPVKLRKSGAFECTYDSIGLPLEEDSDVAAPTCRIDSKRHIRCEAGVVLQIPVRLGPKTTLYDLDFEGNQALIEQDLLEISELEVGAPLSQAAIDAARRRLKERYAEEAFVFADVEPELELSPDHTRGRVRFVISEREQVRVSRIDIRGANLTQESVIRNRIALEPGGLYRRSLVRATEERLATLGVFSSVTVGFEDPYVPAREKVVVVTVQERKPQYLDVRPGFSTGEGFRLTFEYGHRNLGGSAIRFTLRSQLGYLPSALIFDEQVRRKFAALGVAERLERRNSVGVEFPDIGLGPLFALSVEGLDIRDIARDFGLTKDAGIVTLIYRPERRFSAQLGVSIERNVANIFSDERLSDFIERNPGQRNNFRVPQGTSFAIAQRIGATWDRRDSPLDATKGTFVSVAAEHVNAIPIAEEDGGTISDDLDPFTPTNSHFMRYTNRVAGYVRLSEAGLALAASFRWGYIQQLTDASRTYPDRLFFMGGVDSIRGFLQSSLIPEDIAQRLLDENSDLQVDEVVIRGGDVFVNPRFELRVPLSNNIQTALFLDTGNLWTRPSRVNLLRLRYTAGTGLRIGTPVGPLVFDYGFNVERVLDELGAGVAESRFWEDLGAFHFSIGVF